MTRWGFDRKAGAKKRPDALVRPFRLALAAPVAKPARRWSSIPSGGSQHRIPKPKGTRAPVRLAPDHPALVESRTLFPSSVVSAADSPRLLISGVNQRKIGQKVTKGRWAGMPIYTLTLPERTTCPRSCLQWSRCYGNHMPFARRHQLDDVLIERLRGELADKQRQHPDGFVVRLHILGDFGSEDDVPLALRYVAMWDEALWALPALRVFGFTAHHPGSEIGQAIQRMMPSSRCWLRFSGTTLGGMGAVVVEKGVPTEHVVCPAQTGKTDCCATCGLCWTMASVIAFERH